MVGPTKARICDLLCRRQLKLTTALRGNPKLTSFPETPAAGDQHAATALALQPTAEDATENGVGVTSRSVVYELSSTM
jgi:hypothetical protein